MTTALTLFAAVFYILESYLAKLWSLSGEWWWYPFIILVASIPASSLFMYAIKTNGTLSFVLPLTQAFILIGTVLIGILIFGERLTNLQYLGVVFAILAIIFFNLESALLSIK